MSENRLDQRHGEKPKHHRGFLLWAMQSPDRRSLRATARAIGVSDSTIRAWKVKHVWDSRVMDDATGEVRAAQAYAATYHRTMGGRDVALLAHLMDVPYIGPTDDIKTATAKAADLHDEVKRETVGSKRRVRLQAIVDGMISALGIQLAEVDEDGKPKFKMKPNDLPHILRALGMVDTMLGPQVHEGVEGPAGDRVDVSERVRQAEARNEPVLPALREDTEELLLLIGVLEEHEAQKREQPAGDGGQVLTMPGSG